MTLPLNVAGMAFYSKPNIERAIELAAEALVTDGAHHKQWYLEEILRALRVDYERWPQHETGIAP